MRMDIRIYSGCILLLLCSSFHINSDLHHFFFFFLKIILFLALLASACCAGFSCVGFSVSWLWLQSRGTTVCGVQQLQLVGSSRIRGRTCLLSWRVDSSPLSHQGSLAFSSSSVVVVVINCKAFHCMHIPHQQFNFAK